MTTVRDLHDLQELDLEIGQDQSRISSIVDQLGDRQELDSIRGELEAQTACLHQLRLRQRAQDLDAESSREKVTAVEGKLYSGTITNLREMDGYQKEATFLRAHLKEIDDGLLEIMVTMEEIQEKVTSLEGGLSHAEEQWQQNQTELMTEGDRIEESVKALETRREDLVSRIGQKELKLYEDLRLSKSGVAVARVERGLCRGCRVALPTYQLQRARKGRETVQCNSCGRILYVS